MRKIDVYTFISNFYADKHGTVILTLFKTTEDGFEARKTMTIDMDDHESDFYQYRMYNVIQFSAEKKNTLRIIAENFDGRTDFGTSE